MMSLKPGLGLAGTRPELLVALMCIHAIFEGRKIPFVVTELTGGKHMPNSLHYSGLAVDFRTFQIPKDALDQVAAEIRGAIGEHFDVCLESDHLHVEFDPTHKGTAVAEQPGADLAKAA